MSAQRYNHEAFKIKFIQDKNLFKELSTQYLNENEVPQLKSLLEESYTLLQSLYEESNTNPLSAIIALRSSTAINEITENETLTHLYRHFRSGIQAGFVKPLEENSIGSIYENDLEKIVKVLVKSGVPLDPNVSKTYAIFEKNVGSSIKDIILPKDSIKRMNDYAGDLEDSYYDIFDDNIKTIKKDFNAALDKLISFLAIRMFKKGSVFADDQDKDKYKLDDYKGLSFLIKDKDQLDETLDEVLDAKEADAGESFADDDSAGDYDDDTETDIGSDDDLHEAVQDGAIDMAEMIDVPDDEVKEV